MSYWIEIIGTVHIESYEGPDKTEIKFGTLPSGTEGKVRVSTTPLTIMEEQVDDIITFAGSLRDVRDEELFEKWLLKFIKDNADYVFDVNIKVKTMGHTIKYTLDEAWSLKKEKTSIEYLSLGGDRLLDILQYK